MSTVNLTPIRKTNRPTSHVRVGRSNVSRGTDVVAVRHRGREAFFRTETEDDRIMSSIGNKAYIHENAAALFGGIDTSGANRFVVDSGVGLHSIPECSSVTIYTSDVPPDTLESHLRSESALLHPIEEVVRIGNDLVSFTVTDLEPSGYSTARVTAETEIEFADEPSPAAVSNRRAGRGGDDAFGGRLDAGSGAGPGPGQRAGAGTGAAADGATEGRGQDGGPTVSVEPTVPEVSFEDDVAGLEDVKETARMLLALFDASVESRIVDRYGPEFADRGGSMLLYGPPGCGKTHVSEAIANEATAVLEGREVKFIEVRGSDIQSKYAGESEQNVEEVFARAHDFSRDGFVVLFFDEIETLIPDRSDDNLQRHERALTNAFLQAMNDIEDNLFVVGATNMPFSIDPAATRRFPIQQFIPQPDEAVMTEVWKKQLSSLPNHDEIDFDRLGETSVGYTPAEIADRVLGSDLQRELVRSIVEDDPIDVTTDYLLERLEATEPKTVRQYVTSVGSQLDRLEGYPDLRRYIESQQEELGIGGQSNDALSSLLGTAQSAAVDGVEGDVDGDTVTDAVTDTDERSDENPTDDRTDDTDDGTGR